MLPFVAIAIGLCMIITGAAAIFFTSVLPEEPVNHRLVKRDRMDLAMQHEFELTKDPATNTIPTERLMVALEYMRTLQSETNKVAGAIPGVNWTERGPNNFGGRTRTIMVDPNDVTGNSVFAGSVGGGLWRTANIGNASPDWIPVNDLMANLAVTTITHSVTNPQVMYFGTGEGYNNADGARGNGIFKSTNGGSTWTQLASTTGSNYYYVNRMICHPSGDVYAATRNGVFRSQDGGAIWTRVLGSTAPGGATTDDFSDIELGADNAIWASTRAGNGGVYRSATGNASSWTKLNTGANGFPTSGIGRIDIAVAPSSAGVCYAFVVESGVNFYRTGDYGATWTLLTKPVDAEAGIGNDITRGQSWYDMSIAVDPNNANTVIVGGIDLFKSTNGGSTWQQMSHWWGGYGFQEVHADQHIALYQPGSSSVIYFGNDGGVYRTTNGTNAIPAIAFKSYNYNVTQFYACAIHPTAGQNFFLAGAQDNGSHRFNTAGINATVEVTGGDGAYVHIDQDQPQYQFTSYVYNQYRRSTNGGNSFTTVNLSSSTGSFINPTDYDDAANIMYCGETSGTYRRWENPQTGNTSTVISIAAFSGGSVRHVMVSPNVANRVYFGLSNGRVVRVDDAHTATPTGTNISTGMPTSNVSCVAIETGNENHLLASYSNYGVNSVWETFNGGTSWTSVEGNLPDIPVRWAIFDPTNNDQAMLATELGVWTTNDLSGTSTVWGPSNNGLANVRTTMLQLRTSDKMVIGSTHGRGLFSTDIFTDPFADFIADKRVTYLAKTINFTDASSKASSWLWNFGDGTFSSLQNPVKTYSAPGLYSVSLTINASLSKTVNGYIHVLPNKGTPYTPADGGNFETNVLDFASWNVSGTPYERGNSGVTGKNGTSSGGNAYVTGLSGNYADNTESHLYSPNYNFSAGGTYSIRFNKKNRVEISWDGFRVEYTLNKGDTWSILGGVSATWYDFTNSAQNTSFPRYEPYFNSTSLTYIARSLDLSWLAGNPNVAFRVVFKSDVTVNDSGIALDDFEIVGPSNAPLPVELISFTGHAEPTHNQLLWRTMSEINNSGFDIQRSTDGYKFEQIGFVSGAGSTTTLQSYNYSDFDLKSSKKYYYRLKQIDFNGEFKYSQIIAVLRNEKSANLIAALYPNPAIANVSLLVPDTKGHPLDVAIINSAGKVIYSAQYILDSGQLTIDVSRLSAGVYYLKASNGITTELKKMVKQ